MASTKLSPPTKQGRPANAKKEIPPELQSSTTADTPSNGPKIQSYFSGMTIDHRTEGVTIKAEQDFGNIFKVPAQGNLSGGTPFELRKPGRKVNKLELWSMPDRLRGVQATFDDGAVMQAGTLSGETSRSITFNPDESITSTEISNSDYKAGRAGHVILLTDFGQEYVGVYPSIPGFNHFTPHTSVTRGTLIGVYGGAGSDLDNLGIILALPEDVEYEYFNVRYDLSAYKAVGDRLVRLKEEIVRNSSSASITATVGYSHAYTATKNWSNSIGLKAGVKTSIKTGVPFVVDGKVELSLEASYSYTWGESVADQETDSWTAAVQVPPHTDVRVLATITESTIDVPYSADLVVHHSDGTSKTIKNFSGVYSGVNVSHFEATSEDIPPA